RPSFSGGDGGARRPARARLHHRAALTFADKRGRHRVASGTGCHPLRDVAGPIRPDGNPPARAFPPTCGRLRAGAGRPVNSENSAAAWAAVSRWDWGRPPAVCGLVVGAASNASSASACELAALIVTLWRRA